MNQLSAVYKIGIWVFVISVLGITGNLYFSANPIEGVSVSRALLSLMMIAIGLVTFYGVIGIGLSDKSHTLSKNDLRLAIVISVITLYLVLVGTVSFFSKGGDLPVITETMINHFTTIVGVVIAFYFGTAAYEAVNKKATEKPADEPLDKTKEEKK
jgi:hypothetical protein